MRHAIRLVVLSAIMGGLLPAPATAQSPVPALVEVFTLSTIPLAQIGEAQVYYLDALDHVRTYLSTGLPGNAEAAAAVVRQRMAEMGAQLLQQRASNAAAGLGRAVQLGLERVPAVVFDGKYAVYGVRDIEQARQIYRQRVKR